jgi:Reverse transcriptase (RNA-dependent DNA polymerase)
MGFIQSKAETDIWMRENKGLYEYNAVYVDDLLIVARDPGEITRTLENAHKFKLKGVGPLTYHLGCDYFCDKDGTLCYGPSNYIAKILDQFENMFGCKPKEYTSPLEKGDHPEIDTTEELDEEGIPRIGLLNWLKGMYGYLKKFASAAICVRLLEPDLGELPDQDFDWCHSVYSHIEELTPRDAPRPLGKAVTTITYTDANLYHDMLTRRSVTGILHLCNQH